MQIEGDRRGQCKAKPQIRQWIAAGGSWCTKGDSRQAFRCGKIVRKLESHIRRFALVIFPLCHSERIHRSKRKGTMEKRPFGHDFRQAVSLRKMRLPLLPLVFNSKAQCVPDDVADGNNILNLGCPLE